jgi:predicted nucleic acid-binding protein
VKLVVDASVVVKWFVEEEGQAAALAILERGDECFAPELVLVEVAGALDKKFKSGTVTREQVIEAVTAVQSHMTMVAGTRLMASAIDLASELNHPVADCLYFACALELDARLVSADKVFVDKARVHGYLSRVFALGDEIHLQSGKLVVSDSDLIRIRKLHDLVISVFANVRSTLTADAKSWLEKLISSRDLKPAFDSPAHHRLVQFLNGLDYEARTDVIALCWLGRDYNRETWEELRAHAASFGDGHFDTGYIISKLSNLPRGIEWLESHVDTTESSTHG